MEQKFSVAPRDAQLLAAAALFTFGYTSIGDEASKFLNAQEALKPELMPLTQGAVALLSADKVVEEDDDVSGEYDPEVFDANVKRLLKLGKQLMGFALDSHGPLVAAPAPESPRGPKIIDVDPNGNPIFEPETQTQSDTAKLYDIALNHEEIHMVFWAIMLAEAVLHGDFGTSQEAIGVYKRLRREVITDEPLTAFQDKFDAMHDQARVDDGEVE